MTETLAALRCLELGLRAMRCIDHPNNRLGIGATATGVTGPFCHVCKGPPREMTRVAGDTERYKTGQGLPAAVRSKLAAKYGEWNVTNQTTETGLALRDPTPKDIEAIATRFAAQMPTFDDGAWKALKPADRNLAAKLCLAGFQPFHFTIMVYKSRGVQVASLHLNLQGREFNARQAMQDRFGGVTVRPMTPQERVDWQLDQDEVGAVATLWERDPRTGKRWEAMQDIGRAGGTRDAGETRKDPQTGREYQAGGNPIARANRQEQAMARARARVLINGAPLGVPIGTFTGVGGDVIDVQGQILEEGDAPTGQAERLSSLAAGIPEAQTEVAAGEGADTPTPEAQPAPQESALVAPDVATPSGPAAPAIKPAKEPFPVAEGDQAAVKVRQLLRAANVTAASYEFGGKFGKEAVLGLLSNGFAPEQVVQIVKGAAVPDIGW